MKDEHPRFQLYRPSPSPNPSPIGISPGPSLSPSRSPRPSHIKVESSEDISFIKNQKISQTCTVQLVFASARK